MMVESKNALLLRYIAVLVGELLGGEKKDEEKANLLDELGLTHSHALKQAAELILKVYDEKS